MPIVNKLPNINARAEAVSSMKELDALDPELVSEGLAQGQARARARGYTGSAALKFSHGYAQAYCQSIIEAAASERARIQSVLAQSMPGHEALVTELAFDGKTTGPEAGAAVLQSEKRKHFAVVSQTRENASRQ